MSTETDGTRHVAHSEEWSSDEAAAEQEEMMADPRRAEDDDMAHDTIGDEPSMPDQLYTPDPASLMGSAATVHPGQGPSAHEQHGGEPLIADEAMDGFLGRWNGIQVSFVDDPGTSLENADALTEEIGAALLKSFEDRSSELASGWREASDTEQLRLALKQYRAFLGVLLPK
jgi:hypothetical protein